MKLSSNSGAGIVIILGAILCIITMMLHPVGGDLHHISHIRNSNIMAHSLAIFSVPLLYMGGKGLASILGRDSFFANLGQSFFTFSIIAVMLAATCNGLALPFFVDQLDPSVPGVENEIRQVMHYNFALNKAFDYMFMTGVAVAMILWGIAILISTKLTKMLGVGGILVGLLGLISVFTGLLGISLQEFTIYVFGFVGWTVWAGIEMARFKPKPSQA